MKYHELPISFTEEMTRANMERRKSQTRRVIIPQPTGTLVRQPPSCFGPEAAAFSKPTADSEGLFSVRARYRVGDRLWHKETYSYVSLGAKGADPWHDRAIREGHIVFRNPKLDIDCLMLYLADGQENDHMTPWVSSRFMPKWAARTWSEVVRVRIERIQDISHEDTLAEGFFGDNEFVPMWDAINSKRGYPWESNPFVFVYNYKILSTTGRPE